MKTLRSLAALWTLLAFLTPAFAHGPGHIHRQSSNEVEEALDLDAEGHEGHDHAAGAHEVSVSGKSFKQPAIEEVERWWGASLTTGWESRHIHYGVNETGNSGAYTTELGVWVKDFTFNVWNGFGTGNEFQEWDFTAAYTANLGPVFVIPGYNFRYTPGHVEEGHSHQEDEHSHDEEEGHDEHHEEEHSEEGNEHGGHAHGVYGNELFLVLGTNKIPYVTPTVNFIWDLNNTPGAFLEFRIDGDIPLYKDILSLQPYALLGLNFGYNTTEYYGWNNFQFGLQGSWQINRVISAFAGINYSIAMTALRDIDQGNEVWANVGVSFTY